MSNRSFIKWVGGKTRSLSQILTKFPKDFNTYYEPFLGSGVVYFNLLPHDAVLGDIEENLATAHRAVKNHPQDVCNYLKLLENDEVVYYDVRNDFNHNPETVVGQKAAQFIYINKCGYNGLYRVNKSGAVNVSYGKRSGDPHRDLEIIHKCSKALQKARIMNTDYLEITKLSRKGDFVYLDPPYHKESSSSFTAYNSKEFSEGDHERLSKEFCHLTERGVKAALSNSDTDFIRDLYKNFYIYPIYTSRTVATTVAGRLIATELLITNYDEGTV